MKYNAAVMTSSAGRPVTECTQMLLLSQNGMISDLPRFSRKIKPTGPGYARSVRMLAGVVNGYREPERLGVDRWLALLTAWRELHGGAVVVSAGTALTVDILAADGQHNGGYIVPGLRLMRHALVSGTSGVRPAAETLPSLAPGRSTTEAVLHGCMAMAVALIERARRDVATPVVLSGGDAGALAPWLAGPVLQRPDLVLDGLGIALP